MRRLLACFLCAFSLHATAAAHVVDEYSQIAQIALEPNGARVELRLIPGVQVADRVFAMIDVDGDGQISPAEEQAYAQRVLQDIVLEVDGRSVPLALTGIHFPPRREMNEGIGAIRLDLTAEAALGTGEHQLSFRNDHLPGLGAYLVNALVPSTTEIKISGQARDPFQREMRLSFQVTPSDTHTPRPWRAVLVLCLGLALLLPRWKHLRQYWRRHNDEQIHAKKTFS